MAHRSGGGSHSGGHHSSHHSSHGGGRSAPRYSNRPFRNSRRFMYHDRRGRERYIYCNGVPAKTSLFSLIFSLVFFVPFIFVGGFVLLMFLISFSPSQPKPLTPVYESTYLHIVDQIGVIDNEDSLEDALQEFEDLTGISPWVMTVYDSDWEYFNDLSDYAYEIYVNVFSDEQHFLIVYSEPENAEELEFVDWSWEAIQGDDTDRILTESNFEKFADDLHDDLLRNSVSVGEAFENAFDKSLDYMMEGNSGNNTEDTIMYGVMAVMWNLFVWVNLFHIIKGYRMGKRDYQEVPLEGSGSAASGAMGYGNNVPNNAVSQNNVPYQNNTAFHDDANYQNNPNYQNNVNYQSNANYQKREIYQSNTNSGNGYKKYMYYDKNGNQKYTSVTMEPSKLALIIMVVVLVITVPQLFHSIPLLAGLISIFQSGSSSGTEMTTFLWVFFVISIVWNLVLFAVIFFAVRHFIVVKNRVYTEVSANSRSDAQYNAGMQNNNAAQYNGNMQSSNAAQYNGSMQSSNAAQYNGNMQSSNAAQYNGVVQNSNAAQYNTSGAADNDFYNDDARFRSPDYYDDDARYRGSTAYEAGKK